MATAVLSPEAAYGCPACGDSVAGIGALCPGCGATLALERSVVEVWRGYTTVSFIARAAEGILAESPSFRARGKQGPPESPAAHAALDALTAELMELGWSAAPNDSGPAWFELAFDRLAALAPESVDEAGVETDEAAEEIAPPARPQQIRRLAPPLPLEVIPATAESRPRTVVPPTKPAAARAPHGRSGRVITLVSVLGIGVAGGLGYVIHTAPAVQTRVITVTRPASSPHRTAPPRKPAGVVPGTPMHRTVHVDVKATSDTWLELRHASKSGPVVFAGILPNGKHLRVSGKRVWARFAAAGNVDLNVDGKPVELVGTVERLFAASSR